MNGSDFQMKALNKLFIVYQTISNNRKSAVLSAVAI